MLVMLPSVPVKQLTAAMLSLKTAHAPSAPDGCSLSIANLPSADYIAATKCPSGGDYAYMLNYCGSYMVQVDLAAFKANPAALSTSLPVGHCAGTNTNLSCSNGHGVTFFPVFVGQAP